MQYTLVIIIHIAGVIMPSIETMNIPQASEVRCERMAQDIKKQIMGQAPYDKLPALQAQTITIGGPGEEPDPKKDIWRKHISVRTTCYDNGPRAR